jgi:cytochrome c biogenesis protein CcdA/thiol-disulfide isomerase/thioredoxin
MLSCIFEVVIVISIALSSGMIAFSQAKPKPMMLFFFSKDCENCAAIKKEFLPGFLKKYGTSFRFMELDVSNPANYDSLLAMESRVRLPEAEKDYPAVYFMGAMLEGEIPVCTKLEPLVRAWLANPDSLEALDREVMSRKPEVLKSETGAGGKPVHLAYFYKQGCKKCSRMKEIIAWLEKNHPNLHIESFDIAEKRSKLLATALGVRCRLPRERLMSTPSFFVGSEYVLEENITRETLSDLAAKYGKTGAEPYWNTLSPDELARADKLIAETFNSLALVAIALAALGDGVNPCAFATILFFISYLTMLGRKKKEILMVGLAFAFAVFITYFLVGLGFLGALKHAAHIEILSKIIFGGTAVLCWVFGVLSISDYFKVRAGNTSEMSLQLPGFLKRRIHATIREKARARGLVAGALVAGFTVSLLEFACTGQVYLPTITYMVSRKAEALGYLLFYNIMFILPLLAVFGAVYFGVSSKAVAQIMESRVGTVKLVLAAVFFIVGALLFWAAFL